MAKLDFSNIDLARDVMPSVISSIDNLQDLITVNNSMYIPKGFKYVNYLNDYKTFIVNSKKNFKDIKEWMEESNKVYGDAIDHINEDLNNILIDNILERGNSVN